MLATADVQALIVDMDGVLWEGNRALPGLVPFFESIRRRGLKVVLATNNASQTPAQYVAKLAGFGVDVAEAEVMTSAVATAEVLSARPWPSRKAFVIGGDGIRRAMENAGFELLGLYETGAAVVVVGMDRGLSWDKLATATLNLRAGATFVGTNPDVTFPSERGIVPGNGATLAALEVSTGVKPIIIGKPQPEMMVQALARMGGDASNTAVLGDRLDTDILAGRNAGLPTILVLTGVSGRDEAETGPIRPDFIFKDIGEVADALRASREALTATAPKENS